MIPLPRVTFVIDQFAVPSPGQQLLDRFLIGYNSDGAFRAPGCEVVLTAGGGAGIDARARDFGLRLSPDTLREAKAVVVTANDARVRQVLNELPPRTRCFIYGLVSPAAAELAARRGITVLSGTASGAAFRLPETEVPEREIRKAVIVTTGPTAVIDGLEALRSIAESRVGRLSVSESFDAARVWNLGYSAEWQPLFAAAISRSNTLHGDADKDGRTQDVVGLRLIEKLATRPRAWLLDHGDGMQSAIFDVSGALDDLNFAVELSNGTRRSAQLYRPPAPQSDHFSRLAERIERFFRADMPEVPPGLAALWTTAEKMNT